MRPWKRAAAGIVFACGVLCTAAVGSAQAPPDRPIDPGRRVFIDVNQVLPVEVLRDVASVVGARLELSPDVPGTLVTLRVWNVRASTALDAVCDMIGCRWRTDGRSLRIDPAPPPPTPSRVAEAWGRLKKRLEGAQWNFVNAPLRTVTAALARELRESVVFEGADPESRVTVDLRGQTLFRAAFDVMGALGWDDRGVDISGALSEERVVLRFSGSRLSRPEPPKAGAGPSARVTAKVYDFDEPGITAPVLLSERKPSYTAEAMRAKIQGTVVVSAVVDLDGSVADVDVLTSLEPGLDAQAVEAARQWKFRPGTKDGTAVRVRVRLEMTFSLRR